MDPRNDYRDNMGSTRTYSDRQWSPPQSPPPQFQEHDEMHIGQSPPRTYSPHPNSPPQVSPPLHEYQEEYHQTPTQQHMLPPAGYQEGYSTEKEGTFVTNEVNTPDYSGPQVVPGQFTHYPHGGRPFSPSSNGGGSIASPQVRPYTFKEHVDHEDPISRPGTVPPPVPPKDEPRRCGMKRRTFLILLGCVLIWVLALALGLGLGLGLGLKKNKNSSSSSGDPFCRSNPQYCIGGSLDANYISKKGAYNGTGIALAGESWNVGQKRIFTLYFQHHTGDIRYMQYNTDRKWIGGGKSETVTTDAKPGTPLSAVAVYLNGTAYFHIFYIDQNNTVRQTTKSNTSDIWQPGPLSKLNLKAMDSPSSGLQACWKGNYYGDSDYTKFPTISGNVNTQPFDERLGMNIWYAVDENTFQQYAWYNGQDVWVPIQTWRGFNTHAGVGCYSWGEGTTTYAMMANRNNDVEFYWKDTNTSTPSAENHPINSWQNATKGLIPGVYPSTSLGFTTYFYAQMADRSFKGYNITYQGENTTYSQDEAFVLSDGGGPARGLGGTHLSVTSYREQQGNRTIWDSLYVFYQTAGDDITAFTRPIQGGEWTKGQLTIPDT
ncbi:hypothetical protein IQ06DRAFT_296188 [Phaeosphaeriaceae sp. SRC1lsM3a]|nr:hypothetical protein IQ06DRAFT_296188 [Stagonospora sp. SRC1lsM3a]